MKTRIFSSALIAVTLLATTQANAAFISAELVNLGALYPGFFSSTNNPLADSTTGTVNQNVVTAFSAWATRSL
jgi:hypothetical protein